MKVTVSRNRLLAAMNNCSDTVPAKPTRPILANYLLEVIDDVLTISGTDLEVGIRYEIPAVGPSEPGKAIVPARALAGVARETKGEFLSIDASSGKSKITCDRVGFELPGEDPANFPDIPQWQESSWHDINAGDLSEMVKQTLFASADESGRYALSGVCWELDATGGMLIGTDGVTCATRQSSRLVEIENDHDTTQRRPVVPKRAMHILLKNLDDYDAQCLVSFRSNDVLFKVGSAMIYSRLMEGRFPPWREVFPKGTADRVTIKVEQFLQAVKQVSVVTDRETKAVWMKFRGGELFLESNSSSGSSHVAIPIEYSGEERVFRVSSDRLISMLKVFPGDGEIAVGMNNKPDDPFVVEQGKYFWGLMMPLLQ